MQLYKVSWKQIYENPEKAFLRIGLIFGILFLLVVPPFQVPDEPNHFFRAYQLSEGEIIGEKQDNNAGGLLPKSLVDSMLLWSNLPFHPEQKTTSKQFIEALNIPLEPQKNTFVGFPNTVLYSPVAYLPQVLGIALGKLFYFSPIVLMYLGRITNLIVAVYITFLSIKITPAFKWVFFLLALTPMATFQRASLSADSLINSISILLLAIVFKYAFDLNKAKIGRCDIGVLFILSLLLSLSKQAYFLVPFLCFLIPPAKFGSQKKYWVVCSLLCLTSVIAWVFWSFVVKDVYVPLRPDVAIANEQARFVLSNPTKFAVIAFKDFNTSLTGYLKQFIGILGWLDTILPNALALSYPAVMLFISVIDSHANVIVPLQAKLKGFAVWFTTVFLIYLLSYFTWTPVGQASIEGIQGRYFIPIAPLLFLLFYNRKISLNIRDSKIDVVLVCYSLFALVISLIVLLDRYYNL